MKSLKTLVLGTTVAVGVAGFAAGADASAHTSYKVQSGDTLSGISQKFGKDYSFVSSIASANGISNPNLIHAGTTLVIPDGTTTVRKTAQPVQKQQVQQSSTYKAPSQQKQQTTYKAPVQQKQQAQTQTKSYQSTQKSQTTQKASNASSYQGSSSSAKAWIAQKESSNSYDARSATGKYIGKYQLDKSYLNGDYSPANQERVADNYVKQRYGSWEKAKQFWLANGWY